MCHKYVLSFNGISFHADGNDLVYINQSSGGINKRYCLLRQVIDGGSIQWTKAPMTQEHINKFV